MSDLEANSLGAQSENRREYQRARLIIDVDYNGKDFTGIASTRDIGVGGLYMNTRSEIPSGAKLTVRVPLAAGYVTLACEVVYSNPGHGVGVSFIDLDDATRIALEREVAASDGGV